MKKNYPLRVLVLLLWLVPMAVFGQVTVSGTVNDASSGDALPGVSVVVTGTTLGTSTDAQGRYQLQIPTSTGRLQFSYLGYVNQTADFNASTTTLNIKLQASTTSLEEVVVTGLATSVKRSNAANAVASISTKELVGTTNPQTIDGAISGKVIGANIVNNSGAPGGGISVKMRGITSIFGSAEPLYVIDGVIMDNSSISSGLNAVTAAASGGNTSSQDNASNRIADLNPDDIASMEFLKGASAAAIYGSLAAAGVVVITTKRGAAGKTEINFSQDIGMAKVSNLLGVREFTEDRVRSTYGEELVPVFIAARNAGKLYDYEKELYNNTGMIYTTRLNVSGGNEKTRFFVGGLLQDEEGIVKTTGYEKKSIRFNIDHTISKLFDFSLSSNFINSSSDRGLTNNDNAGVSFGVALTSTPGFADLFPDENGIYPRNPFGASNFLQTRDLMTNNELTNRFIGGLTLNSYLQESEGSSTKLVIRAGLDFFNLKTLAIFPGVLQFQSNNNGTNGVSIQGNNYNLNTNYAAFLVNNLNLSDNTVTFTTTVGATSENFNQDLALNVATQLVENQTNLNQAGAVSASQTRIIERNKGLFFQEEVNYKDRIIATAGLRLDKSSNNSEVNKFNAFPKFSLAVNVANFDFWQLDAVSSFKLRAAYGEAGGFPPFGAKYTSFPLSNIGGNTGILIGARRGNPDIQQERQKELEAGVDIGFFNNKILLEATVYNKQVEDLILFQNTQSSSGFTTRVVNGGELRNKGLELGLSTVPVETAGLKWDSKTSFWLNRSEITDLTIDPFALGAFGNGYGTFFIEEGKSATQIVGSNADGEVVKMGDATPDFQMNFQNFFTIKQNLTFSFLLHWKKGGQNVNLTQLLFDASGTSADYDGDDDGDGVINGQDRLGSGTAETWVQDAGYLRLREIGIYYSIPKTALSSVFKNLVQNVRIGASANNLFVISDYAGYDPEVSNFGGNGLSTGVDVTPFPASKRYFFHLSFGF
ncbi:SusC/RagA family TonB-linked outer membrane protein [Pontibacter arcticus]|uniref:SusC/RagA family TonB-linked outer membrane protein n=1 Tax=Pontibacter arcticus TaxID=2080288 RepID=A0A364RDE8_9BACT|nr:SusC/RagA family TonB-linked outer membrane protein [Pontibacter arcticus]RAU82313.1 SusC/RagA family TonB-linked outer membrane protein [Pontibacter arcticus]